MLKAYPHLVVTWQQIQNDSFARHFIDVPIMVAKFTALSVVDIASFVSQVHLAYELCNGYSKLSP